MLEKRFASPSQHHIQQLMSTLYQPTRGESSISDFLESINQVVDLLAIVDQPIPDSQLVMIIMQNVGPKFEMTVSAAQARDTPIGYDDLVSLLLNAEQRMNLAENENSFQVALFGSKSQSNQSRGSFNRNSSNRGRGTFRGSPSNHGRGSPKPSNSNQNCPTKKLMAMVASPTTNTNASTWYTDSGASHHVTTNLTNPLKFDGSCLPSSPSPLALVGIRTDIATWHARLGHPSISVMLHLQENKELKLVNSKSMSFFNSCQIGKSKKLPFSIHMSISKRPLELIHSDVWSSPLHSQLRMKYYVIFVDDFSCYCWLFPNENFKIFLVKMAFNFAHPVLLLCMLPVPSILQF